MDSPFPAPLLVRKHTPRAPREEAALKRDPRAGCAPQRSRGGDPMIRTRKEYEGAQRELRDLKESLSRIEAAPDHSNKELGIISIYRKMYHLWEELEEYYRACLADAGPWTAAEPRGAAVPTASSG